MGALTHNGEVLQSLPAYASQINFDNTGTNLNSTQVENAIKEVNTKANTLQSGKADTDIVASDFDATASYTAGNYCIYEGKFYKFNKNHSGAWAAADVDEIKIAGELSSLNSKLTVKTATVSDEHFSTVKVMEVGGVKSLYIATNGSTTALDTTTDYVKYFTLPVGFRPADTYANRFVSKRSTATNDTDWIIKIDTNGDVWLVNYNGETSPGFANTFVFI